MVEFFRCIGLRIKAILAASAALDVEADFVARAAERKAELIRQAKLYEEEGLTTIAADLRQQAEAISLDKPFRPALAAPPPDESEAEAEPSTDTPPAEEPEDRGRRSRKPLAMAGKNGRKS